jgi:hypothetical protein
MTDIRDGDQQTPVLAYLRKYVESLPSDLLAEPQATLRSRLAHAEFQALIFAAQRLAPHLSREAFSAETTAADLVAWLSPTLAESSASSVAERPPRGSYLSPSTTLRPVTAADVDALYLASQRPQANHRWRLRGRTTSPSEFHAMLFDPGVLAQYMVVEAGSGSTVGLVVAYNANLVSGNCAVATQRIQTKTSSPSHGLMIEGTLVFFQYLFDHFDLRKIYLEVPEYNESLFGDLGGSLLEEEGRFKDHYYYGDRHWDLITYALYRTRWEAIADGFRGRWPESHFRSDETLSRPRDTPDSK